MNRNPSATRNTPFVIAGVAGAISGMVTSMIAWREGGLSASPSSVMLYMIVPAGLLMISLLPFFMRTRSRFLDLLSVASGFLSFSLGMFLMLMLPNVA